MANIIKRVANSVASRLGYVPADVANHYQVLGGEIRTGIDDNPYARPSWSQDQLEQLAMASVWFKSNQEVITSVASESKFSVYEVKGEDKTPIVNHPFEQLLESPSGIPYIDKNFLYKFSFAWYKLRGEVYWWLIQDATGQLVEIIPIPSSRIKPIEDGKEFIKCFAYYPILGGNPVLIDKYDIFYWRNPNPFDIYRGASVVPTLRLPLLTDLSAVQWNYETFAGKSMNLRDIVTLPSSLNEPQYQDLKRRIMSDTLDARNRFLFLKANGPEPGDTVTVNRLGVTPADMEWLGLRDFTQKEIDRAFGVAAGFWSEKANRANSETSRATLIEYTISPMLQSFASALTSQVLKRFYEGNLRGEFDNIKPQDRELALAERGLYWQVQTIDECREDLGKKPIGGDIGDTLYSIILQTAGAPAPAPMPEPLPDATKAVSVTKLANGKILWKPKGAPLPLPDEVEITADDFPNGEAGAWQQLAQADTIKVNGNGKH